MNDLRFATFQDNSFALLKASEKSLHVKALLNLIVPTIGHRKGKLCKQ